jgi:hypothetical protein
MYSHIRRALIVPLCRTSLGNKNVLRRTMNVSMQGEFSTAPKTIYIVEKEPNSNHIPCCLDTALSRRQANLAFHYVDPHGMPIYERRFVTASFWIFTKAFVLAPIGDDTPIQHLQFKRMDQENSSVMKRLLARNITPSSFCKDASDHTVIIISIRS